MDTMAQLARLDGRVALVIGGGGHIGSAVCLSLAEMGAAVAIADIDEQAAQASSQEISAFGGVSETFPVDLENDSSCRRLPTEVGHVFGHLDIVVHSASLVG